MKTIETLLKLDARAKFDTPKKLNRSTKEIPRDIVEQLEDGKFTTEMIIRNGHTIYLTEYLQPSKYGDQSTLTTVRPHQIEMIED